MNPAPAKVTAHTRIEQRLAVEHAATRALAENNSIAEVAPRIIRAVCETLDWTCGARWALDKDSDTLVCAESWGVASKGVEAFLEATRAIRQVRQAGGLIRRTWVAKAPIWIPDVTLDGTFRRAPDAAKAGLHSGFAFPIKAGEEVIGVMEFFSREIHRPDAELLNCSAYVGSQIGQFLQRKQAEEELLGFRAAIDASPDMVHIIDPAELRFLYVNEAAWQVSGLTRDELLKMPPWEAVGVTRDDLVRIYAELIAKAGESVRTEILGKAADGRRGWFEVHRRAVRLGDKWLIVVITHDVTQRKLAEAAAVRQGLMYAALSATNEAILLAKSQSELYQAVCEAAVRGGKFVLAAVLVPDPSTSDAKIVAVLGAGERRLRGVRISVDPDTPEGRGLVGTAFCTLAPCISNDFLKDERTRPWHAAAEKAGVRAGAAVPLMQRGRAVGILLLYSAEKRSFDDEIAKLLERMAKNIAFALDNFDHELEHRQAEEALRKSEAELSRSKSEFLSAAAHELRTPMTSIFGFSELLKTRNFDRAATLDIVETIHSEAGRLVHLLNELLDLSRIEERAGKAFDFELQSLLPIIETSIAELLVPGDDRKVQMNIDQHLPPLLLDRDKIKQALINVLSNAYKYSSRDTSIELNTVLDSSDGKQRVGVRITDHGMGMSAAEQAHVFERFWRADNAKAVPGSGLGMALVKEIISFHQGTIEIRSEPGAGTRITLWFPAEEQREESVAC